MRDFGLGGWCIGVDRGQAGENGRYIKLQAHFQALKRRKKPIGRVRTRQRCIEVGKLEFFPLFLIFPSGRGCMDAPVGGGAAKTLSFQNVCARPISVIRD